MEAMGMYKLNILNAGHEISPLLYGIFLEDINWACDGGLNANMVRNHSFDGLYIQKKYSDLAAYNFHVKPDRIPDRLRYWEVSGGWADTRQEGGCSENGWYARVTVDGTCELGNKGYDGGKNHIGEFDGHHDDRLWIL
jgi:hypothetical protein